MLLPVTFTRIWSALAAENAAYTVFRVYKTRVFMYVHICTYVFVYTRIPKRTLKALLRDKFLKMFYLMQILLIFF